MTDRLITEPGALATPGGGYGFRFFDNEGRTVEISADVEVRRHRPVEAAHFEAGVVQRRVRAAGDGEAVVPAVDPQEPHHLAHVRVGEGVG